MGVNSTDQTEVLPVLDPGKEQFLEYDVSRLIHTLSTPTKPVVGLCSWLPIDGGRFDPMTGQMDQRPPWVVVQQVRQLFEVKTVETDVASIPADIGVLVLVHPKTPSDRMLYALDQFVLRGGRLIVFVDPNAELDLPPGAEQNPMLAIQHKKESGLPRLFQAWGLRLVEATVAADRQAAITVNSGDRNRPSETPFIVYLDLREANLDRSDAVTGQVAHLTMGTAGILEKVDGATTTFTPIIRTSDQSQRIAQSRVQFFPQPEEILRDFVPSGEVLTLAARVTGKAATAFPEGAPEPPAEGETAPSHLAESGQAGINVMVVADTDLLANRFWVQETVFGPAKFADNADLVLSALDQLAGSTDLISVRARGSYTRPFTRVQQIRAAAEQKYLNQQTAIEARIKETEEKLRTLQSARPEGAQGQFLLSPEQEEEIMKLNRDLVEGKRELRQVRFSMNQDIERLGSVLKVLNIGAIPLVVCAVAIALGAYRAQRRRADRGAAGAG